MTTKFQAFAADYDCICRMHGVRIEWEIDYLAVRDTCPGGALPSDYLYDETKKEGERDDHTKENRMSNYYNHDTILDLMSENGKLKDILQRCLPEIRERVKGFNSCWPGAEILLHLHRNDRLLADIERALIGWGTNDTP